MEQVVLGNGALAAQRAPAVAGRGLAPTAFKMSPLPGLKSKLFSIERSAKSSVLGPGSPGATGMGLRLDSGIAGFDDE